jgi:hypothetical protein
MYLLVVQTYRMVMNFNINTSLLAVVGYVFVKNSNDPNNLVEK